jgi:peptidyl-prolyl cis-trans isomerase SurA
MSRRIELRRLALAALCAAVALPIARPAPGAEVNRVVLRVNDRIVTLFDYQERLTDRREQIARSEAAPEERQRLIAEAPKEVLRDYLDENLLLSRADQLDVSPSAEMLASAEAQARKNWGIEDDTQFRAALRQTGMTAEEFRNRVRETLMYQEVLDRDVMSQVKVSDEELQRYYREHPDEFQVGMLLHLREVVLLESSGKSPEELEQTARELRAQLAGGKTLEDISAGGKDAGLTSAVIDLGWVEPKDVDAALAAAVEGLAHHEYAQPVKGRGGWHLVQLIERQDAHLRPYEEVREALRNRQRSRGYQERLADYMAGLEEKAYISSNVPAEAQGFRRQRAQVPGGDPLDVLRKEAAAPAAAPTAPAPPDSPAPPPVPPPSATPPPPPPPSL